LEHIGSVFERIKKRMGAEILGERECSECGSTIQKVRYKNGIVVDDCFHCRKRKEEESIQENIQKLKNRKRHAKFERISRIPEELEGVTFDDYEPKTEKQQRAKEKAIQYAHGDCEEMGLVFQGSTGVGKSHMSYCIGEMYKQSNKTVVYIDSPELFSMIKSTYNYKDTGLNEEMILQTIKDADLFIFDDIGAEYVKPDKNGRESWAADIIYQILNSRLGKRNIYTTNYTSEDLQQKYGRLSRRIISRMMNKATALEVDGKDQRIGGFK